MISEQVTDIQWMRKFYFQTGEALKNFLENEISPSSIHSSLNSNCCSGTCPFSNKLCWFQVHSDQSRLFHLFHSNLAEQFALVKYANMSSILQYSCDCFFLLALFLLILTTWALLFQNLGQKVTIYDVFPLLSFLAKSEKQIHSDQEPLLPRSKSTLW